MDKEYRKYLDAITSAIYWRNYKINEILEQGRAMNLTLQEQAQNLVNRHRQGLVEVNYENYRSLLDYLHLPEVSQAQYNEKIQDILDNPTAISIQIDINGSDSGPDGNLSM